MVKFGTWIALTVVASIYGAQPVKTKFPWKDLWHGQTKAVAFISRGKALEGYHYYEKYNRIAEQPWNAIQTALGAYMVRSLEEQSVEIGDIAGIEKQVIAQCRGVMSMLSNHQQLYEGHVVYQLDEWRNGDAPAQSIWDQRSFASRILKIPADREAKIASFFGMKAVPVIEPNYNRSFDSVFEAKDRKRYVWDPPANAKSVFSQIMKARMLFTVDEWKEVETILNQFDRAFTNAN